MRIRTKFILILLVLSLVPLAVIGTIAYQNGKRVMKRSLGSSFQQIAHEAIDKVDRSLYEVYHNVQTWAELDLMQEVITGDVDGKISTFFLGLSKEHGYFLSIDAINSEGVIIASSQPKMIGFHVRQEDLYTFNGQPHIEDVHLDNMSRRWVGSFSFPIKSKFEEGKMIGVLSAR